ncbi:MAG: class I SAM-dependent methyltransferase [Methanocella sp.]
MALGDRLSYHEVQAMLGASAAHPGGHETTLSFLDFAGVPPGTRVLECGCGTGRTSCHLAQLGARVTGLDRSPVMLEKARVRGEREGVSVEWVRGDVCHLPFADGRFDLVLAESVTVFNPIPEVLAEYFRVTVPGGRVADLEMAARPTLSPENRAEMLAFYNAPDLPTADGWQDFFRRAGFAPISVWGPHPLDLQSVKRNKKHNPDPWNLSDPGAEDDPRVTKVVWENIFLMGVNAPHLSCVGIVATKPAVLGS